MLYIGHHAWPPGCLHHFVGPPESHRCPTAAQPLPNRCPTQPPCPNRRHPTATTNRCVPTAITQPLPPTAVSQAQERLLSAMSTPSWARSLLRAHDEAARAAAAAATQLGARSTPLVPDFSAFPDPDPDPGGPGAPAASALSGRLSTVPEQRKEPKQETPFAGADSQAGPSPVTAAGAGGGGGGGDGAGGGPTVAAAELHPGLAAGAVEAAPVQVGAARRPQGRHVVDRAHPPHDPRHGLDHEPGT